MRKLLFFFLRISGALRKGLLKLRGKTEAHIHDQRITSGKAWADFCDDLKAAGNVLLSAGTPRDPFQQAEGMRYLSRLTRAGLEAYVEYADPAFRLRSEQEGADDKERYLFSIV